MRISSIILAALPALALAQEDGSSTTTLLKTTTLTKTYTLSEVHTVIHTPGHNATASWTPTPSSSYVKPTGGAEPTGKPPTVDDDNAASALGAGKVVLAGLAGMAVVALM